jgi:hypothetical protein
MTAPATAPMIIDLFIVVALVQIYSLVDVGG